MATMEHKETQSELDAKIEAYLLNCRIRVQNLRNGPECESIKSKPKEKKAPIKVKKKYNVILKVACTFGAFLFCGLVYSSLFTPDIVDAIMVFIDFIGDPLKDFRGNGIVTPDNYVMFLK
jgi:hypothetical protein